MNDYTAETGNSRNLRRGAHQLLELYRGHWGQLFWAAFWFTVKHSPAWVTPIVIANIINIVTDPEHHNLTQFWLNLIVGSVFIAQNVLTAWLHTRASSGLTRGVEMELRGAMVHKLQRLSIQYHTQAQTGRLLSKIMRDVENVEQMMQSCFSSIVPLVTSVTVAVVVTALNDPRVLWLYLFAVPVAGITVGVFRQPIRKSNRRFRREMERTQAAVSARLGISARHDELAVRRDKLGRVPAVPDDLPGLHGSAGVEQGHHSGRGRAVPELFRTDRHGRVGRRQPVPGAGPRHGVAEQHQRDHGLRRRGAERHDARPCAAARRGAV